MKWGNVQPVIHSLTGGEGGSPELPAGVGDAAGERARPGGHEVAEGAHHRDIS